MGKLDGPSRQVLALLPNSHPIVSGHGIAKRSDAKAKARTGAKSLPTWRYISFKNAARRDGLELQRWVKGFRDANGRIKDAEDGDFYFARFNQKVQMFRYTPDEYEKLIASDSSDWSKAETDYFMDLCERFDLRFTVIADRYEFAGAPVRSVEDLKDRYYAIARKLLVSREGGDSSVANHTLIRYPYNRTAESERKKGVQLLLTRTPQQLEVDNRIMADCKAVEERRKAAAAALAAAAPPPVPTPAPGAAEPQHAAAPAAAAAEAGAVAAAGAAHGQGWSGAQAGSGGQEGFKHPPHFPNQLPPGVPSLFDVHLNPAKPQPGAYYRSSCTAATFQAMTAGLTSPAGMRVLKATEQTLLDLGYGPLSKPVMNTRAVSGAWLALRSEIITLHETRKIPAPRPAMVQESTKKGKRR